MNDKANAKAKSELSKGAVLKRIVAFGKSVAAMRNEGQELLILIYLRAAKHGDYSLANKLLDVSEGLNRRMLTDHMRRYAGLKTLADIPEDAREKVKAEHPDKVIVGWSGKQYIRDNLDAAKKNKWWANAAKEKEFLGFDADEAIKRVLDQIDRNRLKQLKFRDEGDKDNAEKVHLEVKRATIERLLMHLPGDDVILDLIQERQGRQQQEVQAIAA